MRHHRKSHYLISVDCADIVDCGEFSACVNYSIFSGYSKSGCPFHSILGCMEWTTLLGLFLGFVAMCGVLMFGKTEASFATFIDPPALLMVFGGAVAVVLLGFPARQIRNLAAIFREPFLAA